MAGVALNQESTDRWIAYHGDCIEIMNAMPPESVDMSIFSPPFAELYTYSDSERDMGNSSNYDEFFEHFRFFAKVLNRVMAAGRVVAVHCIDIPAMKERDGYIGLKDFPGDIIRAFADAGFVYHSRHVIWKDPLIEATRTKALGLMHKQLCKDSVRCRSGLPDYLLAFRKKGDNENLISHPDGLTSYHGKTDPGGHGIKRSHNIWRAYASPVWMDIRQTNTLNKVEGRDAKDEKHICPLQLDVIERALTLWSKENDVVLTPFGGIGSEAFVSVKNNRRSVLIELKASYYNVAVKNIRRADRARRDDLCSLFAE